MKCAFKETTSKMAGFAFLFLMSVIGIHAALDLFENFIKPCITIAGAEGLCVDYSHCNEDFGIEHGGIFHESELRRKRSVSDEEFSDDDLQEIYSKGTTKRLSNNCATYQWCCTEANVTPPPPTPPSPPPVKDNDECFARYGDFCPWCVSLYRSETDDISQSEVFCAGLLIGSKVVLTTATCHAVSSSQTVWARFPDFAQPEKNYELTFRKQHDSYDSGTREYDLALFTLEEDVKWREKSRGACLSISAPFQPQCFSFGYDFNYNLVSTLVEVTKGSCDARAGGAVDGFCAKAVNDECSIVIGAPVICPGRDINHLIVYGIARSPCRSFGASLGALSFSSEWLKKELHDLGLNESNYVM